MEAGLLEKWDQMLMMSLWSSRANRPPSMENATRRTTGAASHRCLRSAHEQAVHLRMAPSAASELLPLLNSGRVGSYFTGRFRGQVARGVRPKVLQHGSDDVIEHARGNGPGFRAEIRGVSSA